MLRAYRYVMASWASPTQVLLWVWKESQRSMLADTHPFVNPSSNTVSFPCSRTFYAGAARRSETTIAGMGRKIMVDN